MRAIKHPNMKKLLLLVLLSALTVGLIAGQEVAEENSPVGSAENDIAEDGETNNLDNDIAKDDVNDEQNGIKIFFLLCNEPL